MTLGTDTNMEDCRRQIILDYAKWTVLSAFRSGAPIKSRKDIYPLIDAVAFADVLSSSRAISASEFDSWHEIKTSALCSSDPPLPTGWSVKLINIYLKTAAYIGDIDSNGLRDVLHPPIDSGLWDGLARHFKGRPDILQETCCVRKIKDITDYPTYRRIIDGCRTAARDLGCSLIEVDQLWRGSITPGA